MRQVQGLSKVLNQNNDLLNQLIDHVQPVLGALEGDQGKQLDALVDATTNTLGTVAREREAAAQTIQRPRPGAPARTGGAGAPSWSWL